MAGSGMTVLPQFQGSMYDLQRQQALAQALTQGALTNTAPTQTVGSGQYQVMPKASIGAGLSQLGQALLAAKMGGQVSQGMNQLGMQQWGALQGMMGGGQPQGGAAGQSPQPSGAPADDGSAGSNAVAGAAGNSGNGAPGVGSPQGAPTQGGSALNPLGMNPTMASMMYLNAPDKFFEAQAGAYKPADIAAQIRAAGIDPNSPLGHTLAQTALNKSLAPDYESLRPGGYALNKSTGEIQQMPAVPEGFTSVQGQNGQWNIVPVEGGTGAMTQSAAANAIGKAYGQVGQGVDETGQPVYTNQGVIAASTANGGQGGAFGSNNGRFQPPTGNPGAPGGVRPALSATDQAANSTAGTGAGKQWVNDSGAANGYASRMFTLNKALSGLQNADTGNGSDTVQGIRSFLLAQAPQSLQQYLPGVDANKIASYDEAQKYLTQYAIGQAGALGEGTDSKLATTLSGNANTHISNLAAQDVVKANMGLERMRQAQVMQFGQTGLPPSKYQNWSAQWNKQVDPSVFVWDSMDPTKRAAVAKSMSPQQKQQFSTQYNWALQNKFIDGPQGQ